MNLGWMAWTVPSAVFFATVAAVLLVMTVAELVWPTRPSRGFLPLVTTRGDRFFISLLCAAFIHVLWLALADAGLWWATLASLAVGFALMRWG